MRPLLMVVTIILATFGCSEDNEINHEPFVGKWAITEVVHDDIMKSEWTGITIIFEQDEVNAGIYSMADTKYDSIWSSSGKWVKSTNQSELFLDGQSMVSFSCVNDDLTITRIIPSTAQSTCDENGICLPIATGQWDFRFKRIR